MTFFAVALLILIAAALNRARGDASWMPAWLPGRALYYAAAGIGLASLLFYDPRIALAWGLAFWCWGLAAWGYLQLLGRTVAGKQPEPFERVLLEWAGGNVHVAFFLRHLLIVPGLALVSFGLWSWWPLAFAVPFAGLTLGAYELGWRLTPAQPILTGEVITGALWGILIVGVSYVV